MARVRYAPRDFSKRKNLMLLDQDALKKLAQSKMTEFLKSYKGKRKPHVQQYKQKDLVELLRNGITKKKWRTMERRVKRRIRRAKIAKENAAMVAANEKLPTRFSKVAFDDPESHRMDNLLDRHNKNRVELRDAMAGPKIEWKKMHCEPHISWKRFVKKNWNQKNMMPSKPKRAYFLFYNDNKNKIVNDAKKKNGARYDNGNSKLKHKLNMRMASDTWRDHKNANDDVYQRYTQLAATSAAKYHQNLRNCINKFGSYWNKLKKRWKLNQLKTESWNYAVRRQTSRAPKKKYEKSKAALKKRARLAFCGTTLPPKQRKAKIKELRRDWKDRAQPSP